MTPAAPREARFELSAFGDEVADRLEAQLDALRREDVRFLEFRGVDRTGVLDLSDEALDGIRTRLAAYGIGVSSLASPVGKAPIDGDFDLERRRLRRAAVAARRLGTACIRVFSFFVSDGRHGRHRDEVLRRMSTLARDAQAGAFTLVHENESYIYGDTPERCRDLIEGVGSPALRLVFDPANFVQAGVRPYTDAWPLLAPYVVHVHVKDAVAVERDGLPPYPAPVPRDQLMDSVRLPGEGDGELRPLLRALAACSYQGFLVIEPHLERRLPDQDGPARFKAAVRSLRALLRDELHETVGRPYQT
jgi:3-dehydroshikimate dehydratase